MLQFTKIGMALASEAQGCQENPQESVSPWMFKKLCGMRHPEFATSHQQDAQEFLGFLLEQISREEHQHQGRISSSNLEKHFEIGLKTRIECQESHRVRYLTSCLRDHNTKLVRFHHLNPLKYPSHAGILSR